jgi:hypothetical protein
VDKINYLVFVGVFVGNGGAVWDKIGSCLQVCHLRSVKTGGVVSHGNDLTIQAVVDSCQLWCVNLCQAWWW